MIIKLFQTVAFVCTTLLCMAQSDNAHKQIKELLGSESDPQTILNKLSTVTVDSSNYAIVNYYKGNALIDLEKPSEAFEKFSGIVERQPESYFGHFGQGLVMQFVGQFDNCVTVLDRAIENTEVDSLIASAKFNRSYCHDRIGNTDLAIKDLQDAHKFDTMNVSYMNNLAMTYNSVGKREEGLRLMKKVVELDPEFEGAYANLGFQLSELERYEEASEAFENGLDLHPNNPYILNNYGYVLFKLGDVRQAKRMIRKSLRKYEENAYAYRNMALINIHEKDFKSACENLQLALDYNYTDLYDNEVKKLKQNHCIND